MYRGPDLSLHVKDLNAQVARLQQLLDGRASELLRLVAELESDNKALRALVNELIDQKMVLETALLHSVSDPEPISPRPAEAHCILNGTPPAEVDETPPPKRRTRVKAQ